MCMDGWKGLVGGKTVLKTIDRSQNIRLWYANEMVGGLLRVKPYFKDCVMQLNISYKYKTGFKY